MDVTVLNRLVAARHLIESSGPRPSATSPALILSQKLLAAHDAAELVFIALLAHTEQKVLGISGQVVKDPSFHALAETALNVAAKDQTFIIGSKLRVFDDLLEARKLFKHSGMFVDPVSNSDLFSDAVAALDDLCETVCGQRLMLVDQTSAIEISETREHFQAAQVAITACDYKKAFEEIAGGLASCFFYANSPSVIFAGRPRAEDALLLSGRGIDAASFLTMQEFLPLTYHSGEQPEWELRKFGHPFNWNENTSKFCMQVAIEVAVKLQTAPYQPTPLDFYYFYDDVVEITSPNPTVVCNYGSPFSNYQNREGIVDFRIGDKITGEAIGTNSIPNQGYQGDQIEFEFAEWIMIRRPTSERLRQDAPNWKETTIWVKKDQVRIAHSLNQRKAKAMASRNNPVEES